MCQGSIAQGHRSQSTPGQAVIRLRAAASVYRTPDMSRMSTPCVCARNSQKQISLLCEDAQCKAARCGNLQGPNRHTKATQEPDLDARTLVLTSLKNDVLSEGSGQTHRDPGHLCATGAGRARWQDVLSLKEPLPQGIRCEGGPGPADAMPTHPGE